MIKIRAGLLAGTIILLVGCSSPAIPPSEVAAATIQHDISKQQNAKGSKNSVDLAQVSQSNELTEEERESIRILASACIYASARSMEANLVDLKMLESNDLETELMMQTRFIMSVYDDAYAAEARKRLANVVETIDEDKMLLTQDQLYTLLEMAGAKPSDDLKSYDYLKQWYRNGYYNIEKYYSVGEIFAKIDFEEIEKMVDGNVTVNAVLSLEYDFGPVESYQITLSPNHDSIFQYSVDNIRAELIQPDGGGVIGKDVLLRQPYTEPDSISNNPFNYIFELEGALYQMPFPAAELEGNGWEIEEQGEVGPGERRKIHVKKNDTVLTIGLWNYNTVKSDLKECQVVWIKTGRDKEWNRVNFKLAEGVQNGKRKEEVEFLYHDYLNEIRTSYSRKDPLYMNEYGYELHFENDLITGFEMGYAPIQEDRQQRIQLMTGNWEQDSKSAPASTNFAMSKNHVYQVDIDGDGVREEICVKELGGVQWAGYSCIFIDGELNYLIEGLASNQLHCKSMEMVAENGQYFLIFDGWDYANDIYRKIQLSKGWSREVES